MTGTDMVEHAEHPSVHIIPPTTYYVIFAILIAMTALTVGVAYLDLGELNTIAAVGIACFKATIVVLYFMHVKYSTRLIKLTVIAGLYWLIILLGLTLGDYLTRAIGTYGRQISLQ